MLEPTRHFHRTSATLLAVMMVVCSSRARAETSLFPEPLHLTRTVASAIDGASQTIEEFYSGNRVVSVSGWRVTIADYTKRELITIDRTARTFSVTTFETIAADASGCGVKPCSESVTSAVPPPASRPSPRLLPGNRERFEIGQADQAGERMIVTVHRGVHLSRDALDIIVGSAYPNVRTAETERVSMVAAHEGTATRLRSQSVQGADFGLPVEQTTIITTPTGDITLGNLVTRVGRETASTELITIPAGYQRVESEHGQRSRQLDELDKLPVAGTARP